jgi:phenylacetate-CoA ligase
MTRTSETETRPGKSPGETPGPPGPPKQTAETMPREQLEQLQVSRVRSCVERLQASEIRYYKERLADVDSGQINSPDDFSRLPFTVKEDLREHYPFGMFLAPLSEIVRIHASTGSTGKPTVVGYTRSDLKLWADVLARGLAAGEVTRDDVFQNAYGHGLFTGGLGFHDAASRVGATVVPTSAGNTSQQVMLMRDFGVTAFGATPSYALHVAEVAVEEGVVLHSLPLHAAFLGAEPMTEKMAARIEEKMGVRVYEQYGLSEIIGPGVASACGYADGMHVWEDHFVPEIVDPDSGERLPDGEVGELVLTAPTKEALPIIRYRTRDLTRLYKEPCPCGRTSARIARIIGRTDDMLIIRGVNVFPSQIEHALMGLDDLEPHYQLVLGTREEDHQDDLSVRVETAEHVAKADHDTLKARVSEMLREALNLTATVELTPPRTIPRSEGKAVRVLDERTYAG